MAGVSKTAAAPAKSKPAQKKNPKGSKLSSPSHPPYFQMIKDAILALRERTGSSAYAIAKHIEEQHKGVLPSNFKKILAVQLRNSAVKGKLVKVKASFKLSDLSRKETSPGKEKKTKAAPLKKAKKAPNVSAAVAPKRKKKTVASLISPKAKRGTSLKAKQPKSIKSPAAKRAKKVCTMPLCD